MPARNICTEVSLSEFRNLILEVEGVAQSADQLRETERVDRALDQLLKHPREYFEDRGYFAPPNANFLVTHTESIRVLLQTERGISEFLEQQSASRFDVHISKGKGECTHIEVT